jgi:biotin carboxylase
MTVRSGRAKAHGDRPLLVVAFGYRSVPALQIAEAAAELCDVLWLVDTTDPAVSASARLLARLGPVVDGGRSSPSHVAGLLEPYGPDGIVSYYDTDMVSLAHVAELLGLRFHTPDVAVRLTDKYAQREALRSAGLPVPRCWVIPAEHGDDVARVLAGRVRFPAVLKPRSGSGSWYTLSVRDADELARVCGSGEVRAEDGGDMLVEDYIPDRRPGPNPRFADYVSVETMACGGWISHMAVTGRFALAPPFRESGFFIPSDLGPDDCRAVLASADRAVRALEVKNGCFHTEIKLTPDGPRVIEVNGRIGGGVPEMFRLAADVPLLELSMRAALGELVVFDAPPPCHQVGYRFLVQPPTSALRVLGISGLDRLAALPGVETVSLRHRPGDLVDWREGTRSYVFSAAGSVPDHVGLLAIDRFVQQDVVIDYETTNPSLIDAER